MLIKEESTFSRFFWNHLPYNVQIKQFTKIFAADALFCVFVRLESGWRRFFWCVQSRGKGRKREIWNKRYREKVEDYFTWEFKIAAYRHLAEVLGLKIWNTLILMILNMCKYVIDFEYITEFWAYKEGLPIARKSIIKSNEPRSRSRGFESKELLSRVLRWFLVLFLCF